MMKILFGLVFFFCASICGAAQIQGHVNPSLTAIEHTGDFTQLFGSSKVTDEVFGLVTRFMDNEAKTDFLKLFPEARTLYPGANQLGLSGVDHRVVGHVLDGGYIRKEVIDRILEKCPGLTRDEVLRRLVKYNKESLAKLVKVVHDTYGIPVREAKALIRIDACTHLLGDTSTSVKTLGQIPTLRRIISTYERNLSKFIGKQHAAQLAKQLRKVVAENKLLDNKELYKLVKKTIEESGVGEKLQRAVAQLTKDAVVQQGKAVAKSGWWKALKSKLPADIWVKVGKSKIAKSAAKWAKKIAKSSVAKKIVKAIKPVAKVVPYIADFAFWGYDMYSTTEEYKNGEIANAERNKKYAKGTGSAVGGLGGYRVGANLGDSIADQITIDNPLANLAKLVAKVGGRVVGAYGGAKAGGAATGAGYDATLGSPFEQAKKDAEAGDSEAKFFLGKYYDEGRYVNRDFKKAVEEWDGAAAKGHARAAYELGRCYMMGKGVKKDYRKATEFLWKGYMRGYDKSALPLARAYYESVGVPRSPRTAIMLLKSAVDKNVAGAREYAEELLANAYGSESEGDYRDPYVVAQFFYTGLLVDADRECAINLLEIASENGDTLATCMLGDLAVEKRQYGNARLFYEDAADEGFHEAQVKLAYLFDRVESDEVDYEKDSVDALLCEASDSEWNELGEIQDANGELACWLRGRSSAGSIYSTVVLARMLMSVMPSSDIRSAGELLQSVVGKGNSVADRRYACILLQEPDESSDAVAIFDKAVAAGDSKSRFWRAMACKQLGRKEYAERELRAYVDDGSNANDSEYAMACFLVGNGLLRDEKNAQAYSEGERLLIRAAELEYSPAKFYLGISYLYGLNLDGNVQKGLRYLYAAAQDNQVSALYYLGECHSAGIGLNRDIECAKYYYRRAAELGSTDAQYKYAVLLRDSENKEAMMWCENAAQNGNGDACAFMGDYYLNAEEDETHAGFAGRAYEYYAKGAANHNYECLLGKGSCLMKSIGCDKDIAGAEKCYKEARSIYAKNMFETFTEEVKNVGLTTEDFILAKFGSIGNDGDFYVRQRIDLKKLEKGMKAMNVAVDADKIFAQYDATFWGGAKEGMLLSAQGVYFSNGIPLFCAWKDIERVDVADNNNIHIVGKCKHQVTGEKYRGGYVKVYGDGDGGIVRQHMATVLEVAASINGGCGHTIGEYASVNDDQTFARYCCWAFSQSELARANNVVVIEPGESFDDEYLAKILTSVQESCGRPVSIDKFRIWIDESVDGDCNAGVIITDDEFFYFKEGCGVCFKLADITSVDWERNSGGCVYINGIKCNFLVNSRKPFVDTFKKVLSRLSAKKDKQSM